MTWPLRTERECDPEGWLSTYVHIEWQAVLLVTSAKSEESDAEINWTARVLKSTSRAPFTSFSRRFAFPTDNRCCSGTPFQFP